MATATTDACHRSGKRHFDACHRSGKRQCLTCRSSWAGFDAPALPGMEALAGALQLDQEDKKSCKEKDFEDNCKKHSMPYGFWVSTKNEFYCNACVVENPSVKMELIQNALSQIKAGLTVDVPNAMKEADSHLQSLDDMHAEFVRQRNSVVQFKRAVVTLMETQKKNIQQIAASRSKAWDTVVNLKELEGTVDSIKSTADLHVAVECKSTLEKVAVRFSPPKPDLSQTLLINIACSYVEETETANPPTNTPFVNAIEMGSPQPQLQMVCAAEKLQNAGNWTVDINNCNAAVLALSVKQPRTLTLKQGYDGRKTLPVAALAKAAKNCDVHAKFIDTFYSASNTATDAKRLEHLLANKSNRLCTFYGHLDHSAIAKLPHTVTELGLAIGSAADAAAVGGLRKWVGLSGIGVSVTSFDVIKDLKPLPDVSIDYLFFPSLTDANVDAVRPAIDALVPGSWMMELSFPKCQLTATGVQRMTHHLRGVRAHCGVAIEATGTWRPGSEEMKSIKKELQSGGVGKVRWNMDWFY